jgi:soluble lytic murein transglycosylase-like protein
LALRTDHAPGRDGGSAALLCGAFLTFAIAAPANAQVIEIAPDGAAAVYAGPVVSSGAVSGADRRPIAPSPSPAPPALARPGLARAEVSEAIHEAADRRQLSARLIEAVAWQESRLNPKAVSPKGALGVMQLRPGTAAGLGVDASDLRGNVDGGAAYLVQLLQHFDGDIVLTLAAYNAGPEAVRRWGGVPPYPETRAYVAAVLDRLAQMEIAPQARPEPR